MKFDDLTPQQQQQALAKFPKECRAGYELSLEDSNVVAAFYRPRIEFVCSYCMEKVIAPHYCMAKHSREPI